MLSAWAMGMARESPQTARRAVMWDMVGVGGGPRHCNGYVGAAQRHWETGKASRGPGARRRLRSRHLRFPRGGDGGAAHPAQALAHLRSHGGGRFAMRRSARRTHPAALVVLLAA